MDHVHVVFDAMYWVMNCNVFLIWLCARDQEYIALYPIRLYARNWMVFRMHCTAFRPCEHGAKSWYVSKHLAPRAPYRAPVTSYIAPGAP